MTLELWLLLTSALLARAMSPGPSLALVLRTAITQNQLSALVVAFSHDLGITVYALAVVFGLVNVLESVSSALMLFQAGGVVLLLFLGYQMLSGGIKTKGLGAADVLDERPTDSAGEPLIQHVTNGFMIVFLNPGWQFSLLRFLVSFSIRSRHWAHSLSQLDWRESSIPCGMCLSRCLRATIGLPQDYEHYRPCSMWRLDCCSLFSRYSVY